MKLSRLLSARRLCYRIPLTVSPNKAQTVELRIKFRPKFVWCDSSAALEPPSSKPAWAISTLQSTAYPPLPLGRWHTLILLNFRSRLSSGLAYQFSKFFPEFRALFYYVSTILQVNIVLCHISQNLANYYKKIC